MRAAVKTLNQFSLRDFIAERLLEQGASVSFADDHNMALLFARLDEGERIYLFLSAEEFVRNFPAICNILLENPTYQLVIPVLTQEEERYFKKLAQQWRDHNINTYRLNLVERFLFQSRSFYEVQQQ